LERPVDLVGHAREKIKAVPTLGIGKAIDPAATERNRRMTQPHSPKPTFTVLARVESIASARKMGVDSEEGGTVGDLKRQRRLPENEHRPIRGRSAIVRDGRR
jgi:hypothetical protein